MPDEGPTAVYHLDWSGRLGPGQLIRVEDHEDSQADIYFHPLHVREQLVHELNWITLHHVGAGLWRQRWTHAGRFQDPTEGLEVAVCRWELESAARMPKARNAFPVEQDGNCIWLFKEGYCTAPLVAEMNAMLEHIVGDALWLQAWDEEQRVPPMPWAPFLAPVLTPTMA